MITCSNAIIIYWQYQINKISSLCVMDWEECYILIIKQKALNGGGDSMSVLFKVSTDSFINIRRGGILLVEHFMLSGSGVDSSTISVPLS